MSSITAFVSEKIGGRLYLCTEKGLSQNNNPAETNFLDRLRGRVALPSNAAGKIHRTGCGVDIHNRIFGFVMWVIGKALWIKTGNKSSDGSDEFVYLNKKSVCRFVTRLKRLAFDQMKQNNTSYEVSPDKKDNMGGTATRSEREDFGSMQFSYRRDSRCDIPDQLNNLERAAQTADTAHSLVSELLKNTEGESLKINPFADLVWSKGGKKYITENEFRQSPVFHSGNARN